MYLLLQDMLNSDRKKISLIGRVNYMGGKQDLHLCLKVNKTQWKCHKNCMGGMPEGSEITRIVRASGKLYNHQERTLNKDLFFEGSNGRPPRLHTCEKKTPRLVITIFKCTSSHTLLNGCSSGVLFILICRHIMKFYIFWKKEWHPTKKPILVINFKTISLWVYLNKFWVSKNFDTKNPNDSVKPNWFY